MAVHCSTCTYSYAASAFLLFILCLSGGRVSGQGMLNNQVLQVSLLKDSLVVQPGTFGFNSFTITNTSGTTQQLSLQIDESQGWQLLYTVPATLELTPGQSQTYSLRLTPLSGTASDQWYPFRVRVHSLRDNWREQYTFQATVQAFSRWRALLATPELYVQDDTTALEFQVRFKNTGNRLEKLYYSFQTGVRLSVASRNNVIALVAGQDTSISVKIMMKPEELRRLNEQEIQVSVRGEDQSSVVLLQKIATTPSNYRMHPTRWLTVPLLIESNLFNINNPDQRIIWGSIQGSLDLNRGRGLQFKYRTNSFSNYFEGNSVIRQLTYTAPNLTVTLGTQIDFLNMQINGEGLGVEYNSSPTTQHRFKLVKSHFGNARQILYTHSRRIAESIRYESRSVVSADLLGRSSSAFTFNEIQWSRDKLNSLSVEVGNSYEQVGAMGTGYWGLSLGYRLQMARNRYSLHSSYTYGSSYFPGLIRGMRFGIHEFRYQAGTYYAGLFGSSNARKPAQINQAEKTFDPLFLQNNSEWGLKVGKAWVQKYSLSLAVSYQQLLQDSLTSLHVGGYGTSLSLTLNPASHFNANLVGSWRLNSIRETDLRLPSLNMYGLLRYRSLGTTFRYVDGPLFYHDYIYFRQKGESPRLTQWTAFGEVSSKSKSLQARFQFSINHSTTLAYFMTSRAEISWNLFERGLSLSVLGTHYINGPIASEPLVSLTLRKALNVPVPMVPKYRTLRVVLYKDQNANDSLDQQDERINKTLISINNRRLRTNDQGEVVLRNVPPDEYLLDLTGIVTLRGWIPTGGPKHPVTLIEDIRVTVPFTKSKYVEGRIRLKKDQYSSRSASLDGVRVAAINSRGQAFYAITNQAGEFFLNLPSDQYIIQVSDDVLGPDYRIVESSQKADLTQLEVQQIVFEAIQRKRQINIRNR
ncbi:hypothetical protein [Telluribacter sp.]|uniref:hypothetical protein n=1 Tax=Telluribacter sp. TaxID=1978767 RepID=UPI002E1520EE|nr:hypothetical protein [Telluribacter sp.]